MEAHDKGSEQQHLVVSTMGLTNMRKFALNYSEIVQTTG